MLDIFDNQILCKNCKVEMQKTIIRRNGFELRAIVCPRCKEQIIHPADLNASQQFNDLKGKTFSVKLRMVGNSHAISIPKEIVDFMNETQRML
jgi:Zn-finger nucleic acid-binding protein